jgi:hypothetical protein
MNIYGVGNSRHPSLGVAARKRRTLAKASTFPLDESRWALFQLEMSHENVVQHWLQSWQALSTWEKNGGRTIHWAISTALPQHFHLDSVAGGWNLTAD